MTFLRFCRSDRRGNAVIEFALAFGLVFPVLSGTFQFGYAFYIYNEMQTAVRSGARYASRLSYDSPNSTPSSNYLTAVQNAVVYGDPAGGTEPIVPGLTTSNVTVDMAFDSGVPADVTIGIDNYRTDAVFNGVDFNTKPHLTYSYVGRFDPE